MTVPGNLSSPLLASAAADAAAAAGPIKSLRFNSADASHLSRTPSSASNRKTFTVSCWVKRAALSAHNHLLQTGNNYFRFQNSDEVIFYTSGSDAVYTTAKFRDLSAWYHVVLAVDTTQSTAADRVKIYVNGTQHTLTGTQPSQNADLAINNNAVHYIGSAGTSSSEALNGYLADYYLIDGSQLDATSFGAFDDNGVWQAAAYSGTFGTNGFHLLDFANESTIGHDSSGNENDFTANNFVAVGGVATADARSAAVFFDGVDDKIVYTNNSDLEPSNGNFTLEFFVYKFPNEEVPVYYGTANGHLGIRIHGTGKVFIERIGTAFDHQSAVAVSDETWTHVAISRHVGTMRIYVNGSQISSFSNSQTYTGTFATGRTLNDNRKFAISDLHFIKGTGIYTSNFTAPTSISSHANTKLLCFQSSSSATTATVAPSGVTLTATSSPVAGAYPVTEATDVDVLFDVPTNGTQSDTGAGGEVSGNYATLNALQTGSSLTLSNGNLALDGHSSWRSSYSTIFLPTGKWYAEFTIRSITSHSYGILVGLAGLGTNIIESEISSGDSYAVQNGPGNMKINYNGGSTDLGSQSAYAVGDVLQLAYDADNGKLWFGKNGTYINSGNPSAGSNPTQSSISGTYCFAVALLTTSDKIDCNFGQRSFSYSAPTNFKAVCTTNLPTPTIADGSDYFEAVKIDNASGTGSITGLSFAPDFAWFKRRNSAASHFLLDIIRDDGVLFSNLTNAENTGTDYIDWNSDGVGYKNGLVDPGTNNIVWLWDAGSSTVSNTDGSITSSVRANTTAGFSIVGYTGTGANATVGHGLNAAPEFVIVKSRDMSSSDWCVYHSGLSSTSHVLALMSTSAEENNSSTFQGTAPTNSVFSLGTRGSANGSGNDHIAYCFAPVAGYSAFGSYEGNGSSDGPFAHTGHKIAWLLIKDATSTGAWLIWDVARQSFNVQGPYLLADAADAEQDSDLVDFLSNGFKIRTTAGSMNSSGQTYIYAAFAENPFQANGGLAR